MCPSILTSLQVANGKTGEEPECISLLKETAVADTIFRITKTHGSPLNLLYDPLKDGNVDFLIQNPISGKVVPIEVGSKNKERTQIKKAIENYKTDFGILISDRNSFELKENILHIPLWFFLYS